MARTWATYGGKDLARCGGEELPRCDRKDLARQLVRAQPDDEDEMKGTHIYSLCLSQRISFFLTSLSI